VRGSGPEWACCSSPTTQCGSCANPHAGRGAYLVAGRIRRVRGHDSPDSAAGGLRRPSGGADKLTNEHHSRPRPPGPASGRISRSSTGRSKRQPARLLDSRPRPRRPRPCSTPSPSISSTYSNVHRASTPGRGGHRGLRGGPEDLPRSSNAPASPRGSSSPSHDRGHQSAWPTPGRSSLAAGDDRLSSPHMEHTRNIVPWHMLASDVASSCAGSPQQTADGHLDLTDLPPLRDGASLLGSPPCRTAGQRSRHRPAGRGGPTPRALGWSTRAQPVPNLTIDVAPSRPSLLLGHKMLRRDGIGACGPAGSCWRPMPPFLAAAK